MSQSDLAHIRATAHPASRSRALPPYRGIVAVDAKDFTGHPAIEHGAISRAIPQLLQTSFERADLAELWEDRRFPNSTGDGYVLGFDPALLPFVIHPWLNTLQEVITEFHVQSVGVVRIRLRVSVHVGPLPDSGDEFDGNGTPRNDTHRLLDSRPVKAMLAASSEHITHVAAILSDRCFQDAVASGYTGRHRDHFIEVPATVEGKPFEQRAWLYVPAPSGNLFDRRVLGDRVMDELQGPSSPPTDPAAARTTDGAARAAVYRTGRGSILNTGRVEGDQTVSNVEGSQHNHHIQTSGDYVGGNKAGTVLGNMGDTVHGDKNEHRQ